VLRIHRLVAVAQDDQHRVGGNPADDELEHVDRRLVSPVNVLDYHHGRLTSVQRVDQCRRDLVGDRVTAKPFGQLGSRVGGKVVDRPERSGREERIASASQHPRPAG